MKELNLAIIRAIERKQQIEDTISTFKKIKHNLANLTAVLESKVDTDTIADLLILISKNISLLRARRGSAVIRHTDIPWKHLIYLDQAINDLLFNSSPEFVSDIIANICQPIEINRLSQQIDVIITEEEQTEQKVIEAISILKHEREMLSPIRDNILLLKSELKHYKFIFNKVSSILSLNKKETKKITEKIKILTDYLAAHKQELPAYINSVFNIFKELTPDTLKLIQSLIETNKNNITEEINNLQKIKKGIENGLIFRAPNIISTLVMIKIEYANIINLLNNKGKSNEITDAFKSIRNILIETLENHQYFANTPHAKFKELLNFLVNPLHLITMLSADNKAKFNLLSNFLTKTDELIQSNFLDECNEKLLEEILKKLNEGWQGVKYYKSEGKKNNKTPEAVFSDYHNELINLCNYMRTTSNASLNKKIEFITKLIKSMEKVTIEQSVYEANKLVHGDNYFTVLLRSLNDTILIFNKKLEDIYNLNNPKNTKDYQEKIEELNKIFLLLKFKTSSLKKLCEERVKKHNKYDQIIKACEYIHSIEKAELFLVHNKNEELKETVLIFSSFSLEPEKSDEIDLTKLIKSLEEEAVKKNPSAKKLIDIPCLFKFSSFALDKKNLEIICKHIDMLINTRTNLEKDEISAKVYKRAFFYALIVLGEAAKDISHEYKIEHKNIPWKLFNRIRNGIFHHCIDNPHNREIILDHGSINTPLINACLGELLVCKNEIEISLKSWDKPQNFADIPSRKIKTSDPERNKNKNLERSILKITRLNQKKDNNDTENTFKYFEVLHGFLAGTSQKEESDEMELDFIIFIKKLHKDSLENQRKKEKDHSEKEPDYSIINAFLKEIENLNSILFILDNPQTNTSFPDSIIRDSLEFSIAYIGELARLLKDASFSFQSYASLELLQTLEDWIVKRGEIAHSRAIKVSKIDRATYNKIILCDKILLEIAQKIGESLLFKLEKIEERCEAYRKKFSTLENAIGSNPKYFGTFIKIIGDSQKELNGKECANLLEMLHFYTNEASIKQLIQLHNEITQEKNHLMTYQNEIIYAIRALKKSISATEIDEQVKTRLLPDEFDNIVKYIAESVTHLELLEKEIETYLQEEFEDRQYAKEQQEILIKKITVSDEEKQKLKQIEQKATCILLYQQVKTLQEIKNELRGEYKPEAKGAEFTLEERIAALNDFIKNSGVGTLLSEDFTKKTILAKLNELQLPVENNFIAHLSRLRQEIYSIMTSIKDQFIAEQEKEFLHVQKIFASLNTVLPIPDDAEFKKMFEETEKLIKQFQTQQAKYFATIGKKLNDLESLISKFDAFLKEFSMKAMAEPKDDPYKDPDLDVLVCANNLNKGHALPNKEKTPYNNSTDNKSPSHTHSSMFYKSNEEKKFLGKNAEHEENQQKITGTNSLN